VSEKIASTLETTANDYSRADGFTMMVYENHPSDSRVKEMGNVCQTVTSSWGTGGGNVPFVQKTIINTFALQGAGSTSQNANGSGYKEEQSFTLNVIDVHGVAITFPATMSGTQRATTENLSSTLQAINQTAVCINGQHPNAAIGENISPTLTNAMGAGGGHVPIIGNMAVRRLTPIECERLQGFPDNYTHIKENCPDGPRYKALGNSMAVPVMKWIGERIGQVERGMAKRV
jgi:site-specific DNA-cytosine methylase